MLKNLITFDGCCAGDSSSPNGVRPQQRHEKHRHNRRYIYMVVQLLQKLTGYADSALKKKSANSINTMTAENISA